MLAELLYLGITTGTGLQTLGEEYCDILQVSGGALPREIGRRSTALGPISREILL